jgi:non-heme chloroperoxidase
MEGNKLGEDAENTDRFERAATAVAAPVMLVRGGISEIVSEEGAEAFRQAVPSAEYIDVPGAGHMVAGDRNDAFTAAVVDFLTRHLQ